jgi:hypothetical protein
MRGMRRTLLRVWQTNFVRVRGHPRGNLTGFTIFEPSIDAKLLELLKEIAPRASHVTY